MHSPALTRLKRFLSQGFKAYVVEIMFATRLSGPADFVPAPTSSTVVAEILKSASVFCCCTTGVSNAESTLKEYHIGILDTVSTVK